MHMSGEALSVQPDLELGPCRSGTGVALRWRTGQGLELKRDDFFVTERVHRALPTSFL
jgi:hypothetical protein